MIKWIIENWQTLALVAGGVGTLWNFLSEKRKAFLSAPFTKKSQKITLDEKELSFIEKLQQYQESQLDKVLEDNKKLQDRIKELEEEVARLRQVINEMK